METWNAFAGVRCLVDQIEFAENCCAGTSILSMPEISRLKGKDTIAVSSSCSLCATAPAICNSESESESGSGLA